MKSVVIIVFIFIVASLAKALYHLVKHQSSADSERTMWSLVTRSGLSIILFVVLLLAVANKLITPHRFGKVIEMPQSNSQQ